MSLVEKGGTKQQLEIATVSTDHSSFPFLVLIRPTHSSSKESHKECPEFLADTELYGLHVAVRQCKWLNFLPI